MLAARLSIRLAFQEKQFRRESGAVSFIDAYSGKESSRHMPIAEWVRQALDLARRREPVHDTAKKLAAIRAAVRHNGPTADIEVVLAEIESGYLSGS